MFLARLFGVQRRNYCIGLDAHDGRVAQRRLVDILEEVQDKHQGD